MNLDTGIKLEHGMNLAPCALGLLAGNLKALRKPNPLLLLLVLEMLREGLNALGTAKHLTLKVLQVELLMGGKVIEGFTGCLCSLPRCLLAAA